MTMREQYDRLLDAYVNAVGSADADAMADMHAEDAILLCPGLPAIIGREALREHYRDTLGDGYKLNIRVHDYCEHGDIAYAVGGLQVEDQKGTFLEVVRRESDGSLLIHRACLNMS